MKKFIFTLMMCAYAVPVLAVCSINGCTANSQTDLQNQITPYSNTQSEFQKREQRKTTTFFGNSQDRTTNSVTGGAAPTSNYNANCQFGLCLPYQGDKYSP